MARNRLEDLGRISVMVDNLLENPIFNEDRMMSHDFYQWFQKQDDTKKFEVIQRFIYGISVLEESLGKIREIGLGTDKLNGKE